MVELPAPPILAPMACSIWHRSTISGSRAALSMTVLPSARTAAIRMFSVAPTLGKSSSTVLPRSPAGAEASRKPCSLVISAPSRVSPSMCMSRPREPMASPPGRATFTRPQRASSGPSTAIDARIRRTRS